MVSLCTLPRIFVAIALSFFLCSQGFCQEISAGLPKAAPTPDRLELADIESALAEVTANSGLDESLSTSLKALYQQARQHLQAEATSRENAAGFEVLGSGVAERLADAKAELEKINAARAEIDVTASTETIRQDLANAQSKLASLTDAAKELSAEPARRQKRLAEIPANVVGLEKELEQVRGQQAQSAPPTEPAAQTRARTIHLRARAQAIEAQLNELAKEQSAYVATTDLLPLRVQLADRRMNAARLEVEQIQAALAKQQIGEVERSIADLKQDLAGAPEDLKELAQSNIDLAERQQALVRSNATAARRLEEIRNLFDELKSTASTSRERIEAVGLTEALGLTLRNRKSEYQEKRSDYAPRVDLRKHIQLSQQEAFELEDELTKIEFKVKNWNSNSGSQEELDLLRKRKQLLESVQHTENGLLQTMLTTDTQSHQLRRAIDDYIAFIDEHVFWIRSSSAFSVEEVRHFPAGVSWLSSPVHWKSVIDRLGAGIAANPAGATLGILLVCALFASRLKLRRVIRETKEQAGHYRARFRTTVTALFATLLYAVAWPAMFALLSWLLKASAGTDDFVQSVASACYFVATYLVSRCLLLEVCRRDGLAESHLGWGQLTRVMLRRHLSWFLVVGGTLLFLMVILNDHPDESIRVACLRFTSILLFSASAVFHHLVFRPASPIYVQLHAKHPESKIFRWRKSIWAILFGLPLSFAVLALLGYLDTAFHLGHLFQSTTLLGVTIVLAVGLMLRWLTLHQHEVRLRQAEQARAKALANAERPEASSVPESIGIEIEESQAPDLPALDQQTRQLIYVLTAACSLIGLISIWSDLLPVIDIFEKVTFWEVTVGADIETVTLRDILHIGAWIFVFALAIRNLPSLMELLILRRTTLDSGARYALTTILRYILTLVVAVIVFNLLSLPWKQLGWLLTAASVGLGFGLQEIVANFVSGIIVLLERPVRVGDVVTIDGTTGVVSRIQMRATTVTSWDRKELVVPNKDLITEKLLNWSLSNVVNRLTVEVHVGYDSDPDQVLKVLHDTVTGHAEVMDDPAPRINFEAFGESGLCFTIRYYLDNLDRRVAVTHEVNTAIIKALREASIAIPFPQRDIRVSVESRDDLLSG